MKVYLVFQDDAFDGWRLVKVFDTKEKAKDFIKGKIHFWVEEWDVE